MALREELEKQGNWLFKWRSYLPLAILPILLIALRNSEHFESGVQFLCVAISFLGLFIRGITVGYVSEGTSGRNTKEQKAEKLNTTGMYSIVRHPLYFGNFIIFLGIISFVGVWWFILIAILTFWVYYERIMFAEEEFLREKFGILYLEWAKRTPAFLPKLKNWRKPNLPFSFRNVLKREYPGFFGIIASFTLLKVAKNILTKGKLELDLEWAILFIIGLITYLILRTLKRKTKVLDVKGKKAK